jgi:hypothetical protein
VSLPVIHWGLLGWSNMRSGLEFYRYDEKTIPRFTARHGGSEWGELLLQEEGFRDNATSPEGSPVLVVVLPRTATKDDLIRLTHGVQHALDSFQDTERP